VHENYQLKNTVVLLRQVPMMLLHSLVVKGWEDFLLCLVLFHEVDKLLKQIIAGRSCCVARYVIELTGYYTVPTNLRW